MNDSSLEKLLRKEEVLIKEHTREVADNFLGRRSFRHNESMIEVYLHERRLGNKKAILSAYGHMEGFEWNYEINNKSVPVQNWIDEMDGKYGTLFVNCNSGGHGTIKSDLSPVVVSQHAYLSKREFKDDFDINSIELYLPVLGYTNPHIAPYYQMRVLEYMLREQSDEEN
tara:strand:- start:3062 stop:3571 length:510 start_codon:yes stop_codon:yes gene_type:complete